MASEKKEGAAAPKVRADQRSFHSLPSWLYGTVAALAIKEALSDSVPYIISPPVDPPVHRFVYLFRLCAFLFLLIRFYLGHSVFFERAHAGEASNLFPSKSYVLDFLVGLVHFILFFVWAFSIDPTKRPPNLFFWMLFTILCWDTFWYLACLLYPTLELVKLRWAVNSITAGLILLIYMIAYQPAPGSASRVAHESYLLADLIINAVVIFISMIALYDLMADKKIFERAYRALGPKEPARGAEPAAESPPQIV
jgi:hypothetical protein